MAASSGTKAMGSLFDLMLDFVNTSRTHDSNYDIAQTLIEHYNELPQMSLRRMADLRFVSQASFSRFCRFFLGFDSFGEFKEAVDGASYRLADDYTRDFRAELAGDPTAALGTYRSELAKVLNSALDREATDLVPNVLNALEQAPRVVFFSRHFLWHIGSYFQGKMLQLGTLCGTLPVLRASGRGGAHTTGG
ncbi:MAG: MurR/RpiR family transcriptional regulator [Atopobiaceae bacterium]|nr:MurR/RpiR family transcriptional regulator [Atopobiaceae bacterium]